MSMPDLQDPERQHAGTASGAAPRQSRIGSIVWTIVLVALLAFGLWWFGRETDVMVPQPPITVEDPLQVVDRAASAGAPAAVEAPMAAQRDTPVIKPDRPKPAPTSAPRPAPKATASIPSDRGPVPLATNRQPQYPARALRSGVEGSVSVLIEINAQGVPTDVRVVSRRGERSRDLDQSVVNAARDWRFDPALRDGTPVPGEVILPVDFQRN